MSMPLVIGCYGITQDPETKEFMLIMEYANGGNLHNYLQKNFRNISWENKLKCPIILTIGINSQSIRMYLDYMNRYFFLIHE